MDRADILGRFSLLLTYGCWLLYRTSRLECGYHTENTRMLALTSTDFYGHGTTAAVPGPWKSLKKVWYWRTFSSRFTHFHNLSFGRATESCNLLQWHLMDSYFRLRSFGTSLGCFWKLSLWHRLVLSMLLLCCGDSGNAVSNNVFRYFAVFRTK